MGNLFLSPLAIGKEAMGNVLQHQLCDVGDHHENGLYEVRIASTEILRVAGMSGYHTLIIIDDREFFFDRDGIMAAPPLWSHITGGRVKPPGDVRTEVVEAGRSSLGGKALVQTLTPFFQKGSYDIFYKNCNTFTDMALYFLMKQRLDGRFTRIERLIAATNPISTSLLNRMFRAFVSDGPNSSVSSTEDDIYTTNPEAEDFSVDGVIAYIDDIESEDDSEGCDDDDDELSDGSASGRSLCCYRPRASHEQDEMLINGHYQVSW